MNNLNKLLFLYGLLHYSKSNKDFFKFVCKYKTLDEMLKTSFDFSESNFVKKMIEDDLVKINNKNWGYRGLEVTSKGYDFYFKWILFYKTKNFIFLKEFLFSNVPVIVSILALIVSIIALLKKY